MKNFIDDRDKKLFLLPENSLAGSENEKFAIRFQNPLIESISNSSFSVFQFPNEFNVRHGKMVKMSVSKPATLTKIIDFHVEMFHDVS